MPASFSSILEALLQPSIPIAILGILIIIGAPILLHIFLASSNTYTSPPSVLLLGPPAAGKTSLLTLYERGNGEGPAASDPVAPSPTHTTQTSQSVELVASTDSNSKTSFRNRDDATGTHTKFLLVDTPGHGKLREVAWGKLRRLEKLRAVVFVVDAAALGEQDTLAPTASYLYDVLLSLQKRTSGSESSAKSSNNNKNSNKPVPVLIAANKMDLFTAIPATLVKVNLEAELTRIRQSKSKGLLDSGVGIDDVGSEEQDSWLGEYGSEKFQFKQMQEFDIDVEVLPGNVTGDGPGVDKWWWWIAQRV